MSKLINTKETEFLTFDTYKQDNKKTYDIDVFSKDDELIGSIYWKSTWRKYVFEPIDSIFDTTCLKAIIEFIDELMEERRK